MVAVGAMSFVEQFLRDRVGVPDVWIKLAKAQLANWSRSYKAALELFVEADALDDAHAVLVTHLPLLPPHADQSSDFRVRVWSWDVLSPGLCSWFVVVVVAVAVAVAVVAAAAVRVPCNVTVILSTCF